MKILVIGGTRFFGIHMVKALVENDHDVTIATRGIAKDTFADTVKRITLDRSDMQSIIDALSGKYFDVVIDKIAYCSNDIKCVLDVIECGRYIHMSSTAVYEDLHEGIKEEEFDGMSGQLIWCDRADYSYNEVKRQAERALVQCYGGKNWAAVRCPVVLGEDDYTKRLYFYVEHIMKSRPMHIDNPDARLSFIRSDEAGRFIAFLAQTDFNGAINASSDGTVSIREICDFVKSKTGKTAIIDKYGDPAPYNGDPGFTVNTDKAKALGFEFTNIRDWIFDILCYYIDQISNN
ncbi:MAG: NAD-dependent epimerase/dehydratase family protein [Clostridia bacterium]|nr:NAD-dependent epimerase/dehydratase family protein [Clostridia bacterium]